MKKRMEDIWTKYQILVETGGSDLVSEATPIQKGSQKEPTEGGFLDSTEEEWEEKSGCDKEETLQNHTEASPTRTRYCQIGTRKHRM
ncbi:hypothetical protein R1flu_026615 [Riccia fluitans]|uniref:Uncharacterized protein n=1 Tax=Riccia fluitans TaxID=41844 RepID=A0ABD1XGH1_9MARC